MLNAVAGGATPARLSSSSMVRIMFSCDGSTIQRPLNVNKGIRAYGVLAPRLVKYLLSIRPPNARGYIHANPATGKPYVDIRKQWDRLMSIASEMLGYPLVNEKADFFTFRHTGASNIAQSSRNRETS